jgi:hypothetical protein
MITESGIIPESTHSFSYLAPFISKDVEKSVPTLFWQDHCTHPSPTTKFSQTHDIFVTPEPQVGLVEGSVTGVREGSVGSK